MLRQRSLCNLPNLATASIIFVHNSKRGLYLIQYFSVCDLLARRVKNDPNLFDYPPKTGCASLGSIEGLNFRPRVKVTMTDLEGVRSSLFSPVDGLCMVNVMYILSLNVLLNVPWIMVTK